jgi:hemoglobin/transferrin/lactoferrin receptor protein
MNALGSTSEGEGVCRHASGEGKKRSEKKPTRPAFSRAGISGVRGGRVGEAIGRRAVRWGLAVLGGIPGIGRAADAVAEMAPFQLPDVVVTPTLVAADPFVLPFTVEAIGSRDFEERLTRTLPEAFRETPSVLVQKTAHGQGSPFIRGFTGFRTLMLVEGIRLNNSVFRDGPNQYWNTVDPLSLERMEMVKGPASVLYGSDAIGGAVNAITLGPVIGGEGFDWHPRAFYRVSSAEHSHTARAEVGANWSDAGGVLIGGSWKDYGDLEGGRDVGRQSHTGYLERNVDGKAVYHFSPDTKLVLGHQTVVQDDAWRTHRTIYGLLWEGTTRGTDLELSYDQRRHLTFLQFQAQNLPSFIQEAHVSLSHQLQREDEFRIRSNRLRSEQGFDVHTLGASLRLHSPSPVGRWVYGVEYYRDWVGSFLRNYDAAGQLTSVGIQGPVGDEASYDLVGVFAEDNIPMGDRVELVLGGRYNHAAADADRVRDPVTGTPINISDSWDAVVGSLHGTYQVDRADHWRLFGGVSQGFRAPNLSDLSRFDIAASGELETPAPNLDPERFVSLEAGLKTRGHGVWAQAAYFYTFIDDLIVRTPTGNTVNGLNEVTKLNSGSGFVHGVELTGGVELGLGFSTRAVFTWMEGRVETYPAGGGSDLETEPLSRVMPLSALGAVRWDSPGRRWWVEGLAGGSVRQDRLSSGDERDTQRIPPGGTPGYVYGTIRGGWRPCPGFTFVAAVENLSDEDYRIHGSGLNEPGRNFVLSAEIRF